MSEWVEVLVTYDEIEAEILQGLLESGGIPVVVRSAGPGKEVGPG
jgi:hypothetical protein